ncbi:TPA: hypothetical protein DIC38_01955 [Candidatus Nomurabacteria bacterium]|nr:MAG: hypothetical protein O210_OD1C00001G0340 [Parcubacteria bacterium RAAC4_OD1_1]HCY26421.1 hypothetical protein [Candidatus Nomurabacteria bacterium]
MENFTKKDNELKLPKRLFKNDIPPEIFKTGKIVFNFITGKYLKISLIILVFSVLFQQWVIIVPLIINIVLIYLLKTFGKWFVLNYKNIKITTIKERVGDSQGVYKLEIDKKDNNDVKDLSQ